MKRLWSILSALLLFLHLCIGEKSCVIWSSAGRVVERTSTFRVYCIFNLEGRYFMYSGHPPTEQIFHHYNSTTIYLEVTNLTEDRTYSCDCDNHNSKRNIKPDSCGLDIEAGYPPEPPANLSCVYKVANSSQLPAVVCSWARGRETHLKNNQCLLWVRNYIHNATAGSEPYSVPAKKSSPSAHFIVNSSVHVISVWVHIKNELGSAVSPVINYTLSDIMMPPAPSLQQAECSSRSCTIKVNQSVTSHCLDVHYKNDDGQWTSYPESVVSFGLVQVESLEPYRFYHFRARSRLSTGLWSEWSRTVSNWTQEEAPASALDVWYAIDPNEKSMQVYWKEPDKIVARGKILEYILKVVSQNSTVTFNASSDEQSLSVPCCMKCEVTACARNSRGLSPPAIITIHTAQAKTPLLPVINKLNVTIYWRKPGIAPYPVAYVVEWYPRGQQLHQLQWARMGRNSSQFVITDIKPFVCYDGAVNVFYDDNSTGTHMFTGINTVVSVPTTGPFVQENLEGDTVTVTWSELPVSHRRGCITSYTIYLENNRGTKSYNVSSSHKFWILRGLPPAVYTLWMTASTAKGEGPPGQKVKVFIQQDSLPLFLIGVVLVIILLFLVLACHTSAVKQRYRKALINTDHLPFTKEEGLMWSRLWVYSQCLMPDVVPDPANSKWAKECLQEKGKVSLLPQLSSYTMTEEEELALVDIQEVPRPLLYSETSLKSDSEPSSPVYPLTTYIKSLSHDSDCSYNTQTSVDTTETVDYICSHGSTALFEERHDSSEDIPSFFPRHSIFMKPMDLGPKLTLDAVRIDGSQFFIQCD